MSAALIIDHATEQLGVGCYMTTESHDGSRRCWYCRGELELSVCEARAKLLPPTVERPRVSITERLMLGVGHECQRLRLPEPQLESSGVTVRMRCGASAVLTLDGSLMTHQPLEVELGAELADFVALQDRMRRVARQTLGGR